VSFFYFQKQIKPEKSILSKKINAIDCSKSPKIIIDLNQKQILKKYYHDYHSFE